MANLNRYHSLVAMAVLVCGGPEPISLQTLCLSVTLCVWSHSGSCAVNYQRYLATDHTIQSDTIWWLCLFTHKSTSCLTVWLAGRCDATDGDVVYDCSLGPCVCVCRMNAYITSSQSVSRCSDLYHTHDSLSAAAARLINSAHTVCIDRWPLTTLSTTQCPLCPLCIVRAVRPISALDPQSKFPKKIQMDGKNNQLMSGLEKLSQNRTVSNFAEKAYNKLFKPSHKCSKVKTVTDS